MNSRIFLISLLLTVTAACTSQPTVSNDANKQTSQKVGVLARTPANSSDDDFFKFPTAEKEKDFFQDRPSCVVYAMHSTSDTGNDSQGIEEHSGASDVATLNLDKVTSARADVGNDSMNEQEAKEAARSFSEKAFYKASDRQNVIRGEKTYRITAARNANLMGSSCPSREERDNAKKTDGTWTLNIEEGVSLRVENGYDYSTIHSWKPVFSKKMDVESAPDNGYRLHRMRIKNVDIYYRCTAYLSTCVG